MQSLNEVAWNILSWDKDAVLTAENIHHNIRETFARKNGTLPQAIVVRPDQANELMMKFKTTPPEDVNGFNKIEIPGVGVFTLVIVIRGATL